MPSAWHEQRLILYKYLQILELKAKSMSADTLNIQTYQVSGQETELTMPSGKWYVDALFNNQNGQPKRWISDPYLTEEYSVNASTVISYSFPGLNQSSAFF